jgi:hypothetical protein
MVLGGRVRGHMGDCVELWKPMVLPTISQTLPGVLKAF